MKTIVLAGGCFWGVEEYFSRIDGVLATKVGYANGETENPSYEEVCSGITGFAEAVYIEYDEDIIDLEGILDRYFRIINPTLLNRQGPDIGSQYRTGIYYSNPEDRDRILARLNLERDKYSSKLITEVEELINFYDGEDYHQDYLKKNPGGYCHIDMNK